VKRILLVLAVALMMAVMLVAMAVPAFAAANPQASCSGEAQSSAVNGDVGRAHRDQATQAPAGSVGEIHSGTNAKEGCFGGTATGGTGPPGKPQFAQGPK
jgi:hypothetical protein